MKKFARVLVFITFAVFLVASSAHAVPFLQLDIEGGYYVGPPEETITAPDYAFTLYALVNSSSKKYEGPSGFFISAALVQIAQDADPEWGSFSFNGENVGAARMSDGVPSGLPTHGIFPTDWAEFGVSFVEGQTAPSYNSQDSPGGFVTDSSGPLLYAAFAVDTSGLDPAYTIHFDFYDKTSPEVGNFAPFSHDAQSFPIPEPATMLLLGCGLLGLGVVGKKKFLKRG